MEAERNTQAITQIRHQGDADRHEAMEKKNSTNAPSTA